MNTGDLPDLTPAQLHQLLAQYLAAGDLLDQAESDLKARTEQLQATRQELTTWMAEINKRLQTPAPVDKAPTLRDYLNKLASDEQARRAFIGDPDAAVMKAKLAPADREFLLAGQFKFLYESLASAPPSDTSPQRIEPRRTTKAAR